MNNKNKIIVALFGFFFTKNLIAAPYFGAQLGLYQFNTSVTDRYYPNGRVSVGYLWDIKNWRLGLEGGLQYDGPANDSYMRYEYHAFDILGVVDYVFKKKFDAYLKLGRAQYYEEMTYKFTSGSLYHASYSGNSAKIILGLGYSLNKNVNMNFSRVGCGATNYSSAGGAWMLGINYFFY